MTTRKTFDDVNNSVKHSDAVEWFVQCLGHERKIICYFLRNWCARNDAMGGWCSARTQRPPGHMALVKITTAATLYEYVWCICFLKWAIYEYVHTYVRYVWGKMSVRSVSSLMSGIFLSFRHTHSWKIDQLFLPHNVFFFSLYFCWASDKIYVCLESLWRSPCANDHNFRGACGTWRLVHHDCKSETRTEHTQL